jgi:hypothetical protein
MLIPLDFRAFSTALHHAWKLLANAQDDDNLAL